MMTASNIHYELADRTRATAHGGIGAMHLLVRTLGLDRAINEGLGLLKIHLPYHDSDHVLNIAYNLLAGGTCLEHLELLRSDEAYLDALVHRRVPDPTTAGDYCRRFDPAAIFRLQAIFNAIRLKVWRQQPASFFDEAILEADGTMVETSGECKEGMDINHKGQWGYHPLVLSLANTGEPLFVVNRSGNRPSHEQAAFYFDRAIALCRRGGFRKIRLRGDTDFTQTERLDDWDRQGVKFVFGIDATKRLYELAGELPPEAWKTLVRREKHKVKTRPRHRPENVKQQVVEAREFEDIRLVKEHVAEFRYRPVKCKRDYRVVVVWKELDVYQGQKKAVRRRPLLLLHQQRRGEVGRRNRVRRERPLQPGEPAGAAQGRGSLADRAGRWLALELGVHGDGVVGLEPESLGGAGVAGEGPLAEDASGRKAAVVADGLRHVPGGDDECSVADSLGGTKDRVSVVGVESVAACFLPSLGSACQAVALLRAAI